MAHLHFYQGDRLLLAHLLRPGRTLIGRSDRCDVALPGEHLSRTHCTVEERPEGWVLRDRSRHGTVVGGRSVREHILADGDVAELGEYRMAFRDAPTAAESPTATLARPNTAGVELIEADDTGFAAIYVVLRVVRGPLTGTSRTLQRDRVSVGGPGSQWVIDTELPKNAFYMRVVRGRALVEPGTAAVVLAGQRVRQVTPVLFGEQVRCGDHVLVVESEAREQSEDLARFGAMVGTTPVMRRLFGVLARIAAHDAPALVTGESGTGKELAARGLHEHSPRADGPFVAVNCAGIPRDLFESELFGHEKGAFTGADRRQDGAFQRANGGTLFLDELGELALDAQAKLLRALESGEVRRVGGHAPEFPDVRIVAATNRDLMDMVRRQTFREDLYFRLAVLSVRLPPLSERIDDVPLIARTLLSANHPDGAITDAAIRALQDYTWPGNVRELRNVLTRAYVLAGPTIEANDLSFNPMVFDPPDKPASTPQRSKLDRITLQAALDRTGGNRTRAAAELGIPRSTLLYKMKKLGLA